MKKIAIYGKGGIGKSTTVSNLAYSLSSLGKVVFQIGCDPKADSTIAHNYGDRIPSVLDCLRNNKTEEKDFLFKAHDNVYCIESGGPIPGNGCAGRGIITAFEKIKELDLFNKYHPDYVLYDVLGDVVCGGFAMPIRNGYADDLYIVTSGEMMSLYAADNILRAVRYQVRPGYAKFKGLIINKKNIENEDQIVEKAAKEMAKNGAFITGSDVCVSVTGIAGPTGGTEEKPVGLVYIGCCYNNRTVVKEFHFKGERQKIREQATANALILLRECILADKEQEKQ